MLLPPSEWRLKSAQCAFLPTCTHIPLANSPKDLRGYWIGLHEILQDVEGSLAVEVSHPFCDPPKSCRMPAERMKTGCVSFRAVAIGFFYYEADLPLDVYLLKVWRRSIQALSRRYWFLRHKGPTIPNAFQWARQPPQLPLSVMGRSGPLSNTKYVVPWGHLSPPPRPQTASCFMSEEFAIRCYQCHILEMHWHE